MSGEYEAAVDSESRLTSSYGWRQVPMCSQLRSLCYGIKGAARCIYTDGQSVGREMDSTVDNTVAQVNQHCDPESFSGRQLVCRDPWAITGLRHKLMEARAFLLAELRRN